MSWWTRKRQPMDIVRTEAERAARAAMDSGARLWSGAEQAATTAADSVARLGGPAQRAARIAADSAARLGAQAQRAAKQASDQAGRFGITPQAAWIAVGAVGAIGLVLMGRRRARTGRVRDVMVSDIVSIEPVATLADAARMMRDNNVGVLPVLTGGQLVGVITDRDLVVRAVASGVDPATARVADFATRDLVCARPDSSLDEAMEVMADSQIGRLPVVDNDDRLVGIVTLSSLALRTGRRRDALQTAQQVSRRSSRVA